MVAADEHVRDYSGISRSLLMAFIVVSAMHATCLGDAASLAAK